MKKVAQRQSAQEAQKQPYDNIIKRLFERHVKEILPYLLEEKDLTSDEDGAAFKLNELCQADELDSVEELNIESLVPPRRNDRVYRARYEGRRHVVVLEIETSPGTILPVRSLIYHGLRVERHYGEPIISALLFPFKTAIPRTPLIVPNGDGETLTFHFRVLPLWRMSAQKYFERRVLGMFAFLPAMGGATRAMLFQALDLMVQCYKDRQDEAGLHEEMLAFGVMLRRAKDILPAGDIKEVTQKMIYYDPLIAEDPIFGGMINEARKEAKAEGIVEGKAEGIVEGKAEGIVEGLAKAVFRTIEARFPDLATIIRKAALPDNTEALEALVIETAIAPDEEAVLHLLNLPEN